MQKEKEIVSNFIKHQTNCSKKANINVKDPSKKKSLSHRAKKAVEYIKSSGISDRDSSVFRDNIVFASAILDEDLSVCFKNRHLSIRTYTLIVTKRVFTDCSNKTLKKGAMLLSLAYDFKEVLEYPPCNLDKNTCMVTYIDRGGKNFNSINILLEDDVRFAEDDEIDSFVESFEDKEIRNLFRVLLECYEAFNNGNV